MMRRAIFLLSASLLAFPLAVHAQTPTPATPAPPPSQLDRIEQKLDEVLRRLDQPRLQLSGGAPGQPAASGRQTPSPAVAAAPAASQEGYKPGALVVVRAAPRDQNALAAIPADGVGGFVYQGGLIPFTDIHDRGVRYVGPVGVEIQGWLRVKEAGRYQVATDLSASFTSNANSPPTCLLQVWVEDHSLGQQTFYMVPKSGKEADTTLVLGAELQPGLYRLRVWSVCTEPPGIATTSELLLKAPSELNLRSVTGNDLVHREG